MLTVTKKNISDHSINISLEKNFELISKSEQIQNFINDEIRKSINISDNLEMISFRPLNPYVFNFYFISGGNYLNEYEYASFTTADILYKTAPTKESLFIFDIFDSPQPNNQLLISRNFIKMNKILNYDNKSKFIFNTDLLSKEINYIYIPEYILKEKSTVYMQVSFFNSRTGKIRIFANSNHNVNDNLTMFLKIELDKTNFKYSMMNLDNTLLEIINNDEDKNQNLNISNPILKTIVKTKKIITTKGTFI